MSFPDGKTQTFRGPSTMTDAEIYARAQQERAFAERRIPSTFREGATQSIGRTIADNSSAIGGVISGAGMLAGQPEIVAAGPLAGRAIKAGGQYLAGQPVTTPSLPEVAVLAGEGVAGAYLPRAIASSGGALTNAIRAMPNTTLPQALAKGTVEAAGPTIAKVAASATPAAVGEAVAADAKLIGDTMARVKAGVTKEDLELLLANIKNGMAPSTAAKVVSGGNPSQMSKLMTLYMRSRLRP